MHTCTQLAMHNECQLIQYTDVINIDLTGHSCLDHLMCFAAWQMPLLQRLVKAAVSCFNNNLGRLHLIPGDMGGQGKAPGPCVHPSPQQHHLHMMPTAPVNCAAHKQLQCLLSVLMYAHGCRHAGNHTQERQQFTHEYMDLVPNA